MNWRNHTRKEETRAVKQALKEAGIKAKVRHGTGTAWGWLEIGTDGNDNEKTLKIVQKITGRHGDYDGNILIYRS